MLTILLLLDHNSHCIPLGLNAILGCKQQYDMLTTRETKSFCFKLLKLLQLWSNGSDIGTNSAQIATNTSTHHFNNLVRWLPHNFFPLIPNLCILLGQIKTFHVNSIHHFFSDILRQISTCIIVQCLL